MDNGIVRRQNEEQNLNKLMAYKQIYSEAKNILGIQIVTQVVVVIALSLIPIIINESILETFNIEKQLFNSILVFVSLSLIFADLLVITPILKNKKILAANIQEYFDCDVLRLQCNRIKGHRVNMEDIHKNFTKFKYTKGETEVEKIKQWYSPESIKTMPLSVARIICQRTNVWWDSSLRKKFIIDIKLYTVSLLGILFLIALLKGVSLQTFIINIIIPFSPVLIFSINQVKQNKDSIKTTEELKDKADEIWGNLISSAYDSNQLDMYSRELQNEIYVSRESSPLIFDWYYEKYKNEQQSDINFSGQEMVNTFNSINTINYDVDEEAEVS